MKLTLKNKLKLVQQVLHKKCTLKDLHYIKREIIKLDDAEFLVELDKLKRESE